MIRVTLSPEYIPSPAAGKPVSNGYIYVGTVNADPEIPANQQQIYVQDENGDTIPVSQPVRTNAGGVPQYNNSPVVLLTDTNYSIKILDQNQSQVYYISGTSPDYDIATVSVDATSGIQTVNLTGIPMTIAKSDNTANVVRIIPDSTNTIMGLSYYDLHIQYDSITLRLVDGVYIEQ